MNFLNQISRFRTECVIYLFKCVNFKSFVRKYLKILHNQEKCMKVFKGLKKYNVLTLYPVQSDKKVCLKTGDKNTGPFRMCYISI